MYEHRTTDTRLAVWLFCGLTLLYLSTARGIFEYGDDFSMLQVTRSIVERWDIDVPKATPGAAQGADGRYYSKYGIGQSIIAIPFYIIGRMLPADRPLVTSDGQFTQAQPSLYMACVVGSLSASAGVAIFFLIARLLRFRVFGSLISALSLGMGTFVWHYARTFMTEPTSMLAILACVYSLLRSSAVRPRWLYASGVAMGFALLLRPTNVIALPAMLFLLVARSWTDSHGLRRSVVNLCKWVAPVIIAVAIIGMYNLMRFGNIWETGYGAEATAFTTPVYVGLYGFLLSPGKSIFLYAPVALLGLAGWHRCWRRISIMAAAAALLILSYMLFYGSYYQWFGGGAWGPRFLVPVLPYFVIGVAPLVDSISSAYKRTVLAMVIGLSILIQIASVLVPYVRYESAMEATPQSFAQLLWNPAYSPVIHSIKSLFQRTGPLDLAPTYYGSSTIAWIQGAELLAAFLVFGVGLTTLFSRGSFRPGSRRTTGPSASGPSTTDGHE